MVCSYGQLENLLTANIKSRKGKGKAMTKEKAQRMIEYLEKRKMVFCFDENGELWTFEKLSFYVLAGHRPS